MEFLAEFLKEFGKVISITIDFGKFKLKEEGSWIYVFLAFAATVLVVIISKKLLGTPKEDRSQKSDHSNPITAASITYGQRDVKEYGCKKTVLHRGGDKDNGHVAIDYVAPNATAKGERHGGSDFVGRGYSGEEATEIMKNTQDELIRVKIVGHQLEFPFQREFSPLTTVFEICREVQKEAKNIKQLTLKRGDYALPEDLTLAQAAVDGSTVNWRAHFAE